MNQPKKIVKQKSLTFILTFTLSCCSIAAMENSLQKNLTTLQEKFKLLSQKLQPQQETQVVIPPPVEPMAVVAEHPVNTSLKNLAEETGGGGGYKYANLVQLQKLASQATEEIKNQTEFSINIPTFVLITSSTIKTFLFSYGLGLDIDKKWQEITKGKELSQIQQNPSVILPAAAQLEKEVKNIFDAVIQQLDQKTFKEIFNLAEDPLESFDKTKKLMIRSSGGEDREDLANAGGNETVANVAPEAKDVLTAMSVVVASYFSAKSLNQRINAGDDVTKTPLIPVLIQEMVGEDLSKSSANFNKIPRCGVMFTSDPEGGYANYSGFVWSQRRSCEQHCQC
jgi:hypothetical protein